MEMWQSNAFAAVLISMGISIHDSIYPSRVLNDSLAPLPLRLQSAQCTLMYIMKTLSATEFRQRLFETMRAVSKSKEPVMVSMHGEDLAAIVPAEEARRRSVKPKIDKPRLARFCKRHRVKEMSLFGSILRDDFRPDSDVDVIVEFLPGKRPVFDLIEMKEELETFFHRKVDLLTKSAVMSDHSVTRRDSIINNSMVVYGR